MNLLAKIKEKKEALKEYRLKKAENKAFQLEKTAKEEKEYSNIIMRQNKAKATISEARRIQNPFLYKIGDNVKQNFKEARKQSASNKIKISNKDIFGQKTNSNPFLNSGSATPYYLKTKTKKPYWLK